MMKLASSPARSARNGMSPSRIYICLRSSVTSDTQRHTVNPQMAAQPIMVAITVIIASRVFCSRDFISMIILFV